MSSIFFELNGEDIYSFQGMVFFPGEYPPVGSFITVVDYRGDKKSYKVQQLEFLLRKLFDTQTDLEPQVIVHLRNLRPGEKGNTDEPTGY